MSFYHIVDVVRSLTGERYDFVIDANKKIGNYWIRISGTDNCATKHLHQEAILRYDGADEIEPIEPIGYLVGFENNKTVCMTMIFRKIV